MQNNASFTMLEYPCMATRLKEEMREGFREFRSGPRAYVRSAFAREGRGSRRGVLLRLGLAFGLLFYAVAFSLMLILSNTNGSGERATGNPGIIVFWPPLHTPRVDLPPDDAEAGGGGGGGRRTETPASAGEVPAPLLNPMVGPRPEDQIRPPALPIIEAVLMDPRIPTIRDDAIPTGVPDGVAGPPSAGPGLNGGIGAGLNGGIGIGDGPGVGPGIGGNTGEKTFQIGGPRKAAFRQPEVDIKPILLNEPRPLYTEDARKNKIQGVVKVRIFVNETGGVSEVVVTRGLPDGLSEQAIRAAYQMRFKPAMKSGQRVSYWITNVEIEFNLR